MSKTPPPELCGLCKHLKVERTRLVAQPKRPGEEPTVAWTCKAFPRGIPRAIADGRHDHRESYKGDHGTRFEPHAVGASEPPPIPAPCVGCRHLAGFARVSAAKVIVTDAGIEWGCAAFPAGIPAAIRDGRHRHRRPFPGDRGTRFEPLEADR